MKTKGCPSCQILLDDPEKRKQMDALMDEILNSNGKVDFEEVTARAQAIINSSRDEVNIVRGYN